MFTIVHKLSSHHPRLHAAQRKHMIHDRLEFQRRFQIHFQVEEVQQINHETVDDVRLITFAYTIQIERMLWEYHAEPLRISRRKN